MTSEVNHGQRLETLGSLAAGVVHDVNNLLTVITNYAGLALEPQDGEDEDSQRLRRLLDDVERIHRVARRGTALTRRLLTYASPDGDRAQVVSVNEAVRESVAMLRGSTWRRVDIVTDLDRECWPVRADPIRLGQAMVNLAVNARDAMAEGGVLTIKTGNVSAERVSAGDLVKIEVTDTGSGIPSGLLDRIFEPFFSTKPAGAGTGLGLALVRDFVTECGGRVLVESTPEVGSRFELLFPALATSRDQEKAGRPSGGEGRVRTE